jgi:hypothetical protein
MPKCSCPRAAERRRRRSHAERGNQKPVENARRQLDTGFAAIVRAQGQAGDVKGALETLARIQGEEDKAVAFEIVVKAQVQAGDERGALALAARQTSPLLKAHALLAIISGKANQNATKK